MEKAKDLKELYYTRHTVNKMKITRNTTAKQKKTIFES